MALNPDVAAELDDGMTEMCDALADAVIGRLAEVGYLSGEAFGHINAARVLVSDVLREALA